MHREESSEESSSFIKDLKNAIDYGKENKISNALQSALIAVEKVLEHPAEKELDGIEYMKSLGSVLNHLYKYFKAQLDDLFSQASPMSNFSQINNTCQKLVLEVD